MFVACFTGVLENSLMQPRNARIVRKGKVDRPGIKPARFPSLFQHTSPDLPILKPKTNYHYYNFNFKLFHRSSLVTMKFSAQVLFALLGTSAVAREVTQALVAECGSTENIMVVPAGANETEYRHCANHPLGDAKAQVARDLNVLDKRDCWRGAETGCTKGEYPRHFLPSICNSSPSYSSITSIDWAPCLSRILLETMRQQLQRRQLVLDGQGRRWEGGLVQVLRQRAVLQLHAVWPVQRRQLPRLWVRLQNQGRVKTGCQSHQSLDGADGTNGKPVVGPPLHFLLHSFIRLGKAVKAT